jgi:hypothetical protein
VRQLVNYRLGCIQHRWIDLVQRGEIGRDRKAEREQIPRRAFVAGAQAERPDRSRSKTRPTSAWLRWRPPS